MTQASIQYRLVKNILFKGIVLLISSLCAVPLVLVLYFIIKKGIATISWTFLTSLPKPVGETGGGIVNAITGTLLIILVASVIAIPIGVFGGVYLAENKKSRITNIARTCVEVLQGVPSIVIGIIAYLWVVKPTGNFSALSGSIALAIMMLPVIVRTTEETISLIPYSIKEAGLALGVPYHKVLLKVVIPSGLSGIVTGITISIARVAGETAPLLFTAFGNPFQNFNILRPMNSLPLLVFNYATSPYQDWKDQAWGASFVLLVIILLINILTKLAIRRWKIQF
jgi:phosphate transport system permease protein